MWNLFFKNKINWISWFLSTDWSHMTPLSIWLMNNYTSGIRLNSNNYNNWIICISGLHLNISSSKILKNDWQKICTVYRSIMMLVLLQCIVGRTFQHSKIQVLLIILRCGNGRNNAEKNNFDATPWEYHFFSRVVVHFHSFVHNVLFLFFSVFVQEQNFVQWWNSDWNLLQFTPGYIERCWACGLYWLQCFCHIDTILFMSW